MLSAGWNAFAQMEVETWSAYPDLGVLQELTSDLYLVTSGFRRLQQSKIKALGFEHLFKGIFIDALDEPERKGKEGIFRSIMDAAGLSPEEVVIVGDNPDSEIEVGEPARNPDRADIETGSDSRRACAPRYRDFD